MNCHQSDTSQETRIPLRREAQLVNQRSNAACLSNGYETAAPLPCLTCHPTCVGFAARIGMSQERYMGEKIANPVATHAGVGVR